MLSIDPVNTQAILIGASQFEQSDKLPSLPAVENNVWALKRLFADFNIMGIPCDNITVIGNALSSDEITSQLLPVVPKAKDTLIIYYAGHGVVCPKRFFYLATKNTINSKPEATGALLFSKMRNVIMENAVSRKIIFILDCCYSGRAIEEFHTIGRKKVFIITATPSDEVAIAPEGATYTAFTNELLHIFEKGIDNRKETLTLWDIYENMKNQLVGKYPEPQHVIFNGAHNLEIAYNRAYQPPKPQNGGLAKTNLTGRHRSIRNRGEIDQLWQELDNEWDWIKDLPELNFGKAIKDFIDQLQQNLKLGLSPVFLLQKSNSMGGELFILKIKSLLERQIRLSCPVEIRFHSKPSAFEILNSLAAYVKIKPTDEQDWQAYAVNIIERMFKPLRRNSDVVFIELKNCHYLSSDVLEWFVNEFWDLVENKLATISKNYIRVICVITADKKIKPSSEKLIELPLHRWEVDEIQDWLERYSNLDACSDFEGIAQDIYECCDDGLPKLVCDELKERLNQI
jgi:hypothetical protein